MADEIKTFSAYQVAREIPSLDAFADVLDDFLNVGGKQMRDGIKVGEKLRHTHRTLQRQVVAFCLGIICGISDQEYTDARNEYAISAAKTVKRMVDDGTLYVGPYI